MTTLPARRSRWYTSEAPWFEILRHRQARELARRLDWYFEQYRPLPWPEGMAKLMYVASIGVRIVGARPEDCPNPVIEPLPYCWGADQAEKMAEAIKRPEFRQRLAEIARANL